MDKRLESRNGVNEDELFREAFKVFDKDNSGKLSKAELRQDILVDGADFAVVV